MVITARDLNVQSIKFSKFLMNKYFWLAKIYLYLLLIYVNAIGRHLNNWELQLHAIAAPGSSPARVDQAILALIKMSRDFL